MRAITDVLYDRTPPTPRQQQAIDDVHAMAHRFASGAATLAQVRSGTTARQRNLAIRNTRPEHPAFGPMMDMLDVLVAQDPTAFITPRGVIDGNEVMAGYGRTIPHADGGQELQFPIRHPWKSKPDKDGAGGERNEPIYRSASDRKPTYGSAAVDDTPQIKEWWED